MKKKVPLLMVLLLLICIMAEATEPSASDATNSAIKFLVAANAAQPNTTIHSDNPFAGKIVRVNMAGGEAFILENAKLTTLIGDEFFFVGTGVKDSPRQTSWCEGLEVHLSLRSVSSYMPMTPEQWKDRQPFTSSPSVGPFIVPNKPQARLNPIPAPPKPLEPKPIDPNQPAPTVPAAGSPLVPSQPLVPNPVPPTPPAIPTPTLPSQPTKPTALSAPIAPTIDATPLKALQDERVKMLKQLVDIAVAQYRVGTVDFNLLSSAQNEWCDAQLDSMDEPEKRVALLTKQIDMANDILKIVQARFEAGTVTELDICRVKALHLGLKIKLQREQGGKRPSDSTGKQS